MVKFYRIPDALLEKFWSLVGPYHHDLFLETLKALNEKWEELAVEPQLLFEMLRMKGYCLIQVHDYSGALRCYGEALKLEPNDSKMRDNYENVLAQVFAEMSRKMDENDWDALLELTDAYLTYSNNLNCRWFQAVAYDSKGESLKAKEILEEVIKTKPLESFYYCSYLIVCRHLSDFDAGLTVGCRALTLLRENGRKCSDLQQLIEEIKGGENVSKLRIVRKSNDDRNGSQVH